MLWHKLYECAPQLVDLKSITSYVRHYRSEDQSDLENPEWHNALPLNRLSQLDKLLFLIILHKENWYKHVLYVSAGVTLCPLMW